MTPSEELHFLWISVLLQAAAVKLENQRLREEIRLDGTCEWHSGSDGRVLRRLQGHVQYHQVPVQPVERTLG